MVVDIAADLLTWRVGVFGTADVGREKEYLEIVPFVNRDGAAVFVRVGRQYERLVRVVTHLTEFLSD